MKKLDGVYAVWQRGEGSVYGYAAWLRKGMPYLLGIWAKKNGRAEALPFH